MCDLYMEVGVRLNPTAMRPEEEVRDAAAVVPMVLEARRLRELVGQRHRRAPAPPTAEPGMTRKGKQLAPLWSP